MRPDAEDVLIPEGPYDLRSTVFGFTWNPTDPCRWMRQGVFAMADRWPAGPATLAVRQEGDAVRARAWGPGAEEAVAAAPRICGLRDQMAGFDPQHPLIRALRARRPGQRLGATGRIFREIVPTILGQLVTTKDAAERWRALARQVGEPAPGPLRLLLPPEAHRVARMASWRFSRIGIPLKQAETIRRVAERAGRLEEALDLPHDEGMRRLQVIRGIGPWTAGTVLGAATGHPDTVIRGDLHLPRTVAWHLAGETEADDDRMEALLEPVRPHRYRVLLLMIGGGLGPVRRGPIEGFGTGSAHRR